MARASYNRNFQTPPLENLLLSSSPEAAALAPDSVREALGDTYQPIRSERQDVVEVGYQRGLGQFGSLDMSVYWKGSRDQQDNNNFFDTGIIFPTTLAAIDVRGAEGRPGHSGAARRLGHLVGDDEPGDFDAAVHRRLVLGQDAVDLLSAGPFAIDHDQRLSMHGTAQWRGIAGWWAGTSVRYDSGLVANPSDPAEVARDPDFADLLPYVDLNASVPRVRPRTILDLVTGFDVRRRPAGCWTLQTAGHQPDEPHRPLQLPIGVRRHPPRPAQNVRGSHSTLLLSPAPCPCGLPGAALGLEAWGFWGLELEA